MNSFKTSKKQLAFIFIFLGSILIWHKQSFSSAPLFSNHSSQFNEEVACAAELATTIDSLFNSVVKLILDFVDDNNQESYGTHVQKFASKINEIKEEVLQPINEKLQTAQGPFRDALLLVQDIVQNMLNQINTLHTVLVKHLPNKNAINLKGDLEPVIQRITSTETVNALLKKLQLLQNILLQAGHRETSAQISVVIQQLQKAKSTFDAQKVSPKMLAVLRARLRCK